MKAIPQELKFGHQNALKMALDFIKDDRKGLAIKESTLINRYGMAHSTLTRIGLGEDMPRAYDKYLRLFVKVLNDYVRSPIHSSETEKSNGIRNLLADMMLVHCNIPTEAEIRKFEYQKKFGCR